MPDEGMTPQHRDAAASLHGVRPLQRSRNALVFCRAKLGTPLLDRAFWGMEKSNNKRRGTT